MAYFEQTDILARMSEKDLEHWLDDDGDQVADDGLFAAVRTTAQDTVDGLLEPLYSVPFADGSVPAVVKTSAVVVFCSLLYKRRGTSDSDNPFADEAKRALERLEKIGEGKIPLSPDVLPDEHTGEIDDTDLDFDLASQEGI